MLSRECVCLVMGMGSAVNNCGLKSTFCGIEKAGLWIALQYTLHTVSLLQRTLQDGRIHRLLIKTLSTFTRFTDGDRQTD